MIVICRETLFSLVGYMFFTVRSKTRGFSCFTGECKAGILALILIFNIQKVRMFTRRLISLVIIEIGAGEGNRALVSIHR